MRPTLIVRLAVQSSVLVLTAVGSARGGQVSSLSSEVRRDDDLWRDRARPLAVKIVSVAGPQAEVAITFKNASSLAANDAEDARRALRAELRRDGLLLVGAPSAADFVAVTLSENFAGLLWIAEIKSVKSPDAVANVVMAAVPRPVNSMRDRIPPEMTVRKTHLFAQSDPILDVALLDPVSGSCDENSEAASGSPQAVSRSEEQRERRCGGARLLVLDSAQIALYVSQETGWRLEQAIPLGNMRPRARDPRGRLFVPPEGSFTAYLPGGVCDGTLQPALGATCLQRDEPWPLESRGTGPVRSMARAVFGANSNSFTGRFTASDGAERQVGPFFSAAVVPESGGRLWMFGGLDGRVHLYGEGAAPRGSINVWGDEMATLRSECGSGWQVLATRPSDFAETDSIQAYEIVDEQPVAVSPGVEFEGPITVLWPSETAAAALAVSRNLKSGFYEAFHLSIRCGR